MKIWILISLFSITTFAHNFTVMTYNAQNLFDTTHDIGKNDYTYLPLAFKLKSPEVQAYCASMTNDYYRDNCFNFDWNEDVLAQKIINLKKSILAYNNGLGADVIALQEVENINALTQLQKALESHGYKYVSLIEGPDSRGIDVGYISKYKIQSEKLHLIDMEGVAKKTRGILEIELNISGKRVTLFNNHWPSQNNPDEARLIAAQRLAQVANQTDSDIVIALGDFNTLYDDAPHGINIEIKPIFNLARAMASGLGMNLFDGSHWYAGHWSALDKIMILKDRSYKIKPLYNQYEILNHPFLLGETVWTDRDTGEQTTYQDVPLSYNTETGRGYSDHLPVVMEFKIKK